MELRMRCSTDARHPHWPLFRCRERVLHSSLNNGLKTRVFCSHYGQWITPSGVKRIARVERRAAGGQMLDLAKVDCIGRAAHAMPLYEDLALSMCRYAAVQFTELHLILFIVFH
eukprot:1003358-Amphidinium_carterae.1